MAPDSQAYAYWSARLLESGFDYPACSREATNAASRRSSTSCSRPCSPSSRLAFGGGWATASDRLNLAAHVALGVLVVRLAARLTGSGAAGLGRAPALSALLRPAHLGSVRALGRHLRPPRLRHLHPRRGQRSSATRKGWLPVLVAGRGRESSTARPAWSCCPTSPGRSICRGPGGKARQARAGAGRARRAVAAGAAWPSPG